MTEVPLCSNTCLNHADFDKANTSILTALSHHEALTVCRFTQVRVCVRESVREKECGCVYVCVRER